MSYFTLYDRLYQRYPVSKLPLEDESIDVEKLRYHLDKISKVNPYYVKQILKRIVDSNCLLSTNPDDDLEWVYEMYIPLLNIPESTSFDQLDEIRYLFLTPNTIHNNIERNWNLVKVDIYEKPNVISALSTTGFRTWEASLYLTDYLLRLDNPELLDKNGTYGNVLELGCGTGLCSIALIKAGLVKRSIVTDGDSSLVEGQLTSNLALNGVDYGSDSCCVELRRLWWGEDDTSGWGEINTIIGADITYDAASLDALCRCIAQIFEQYDSCKHCIISATIRNESTINKFVELIQSTDYCLEIELLKSTKTDTEGKERLTQDNWFKPLIAPINIYKICRRK